MGFSWLPPRLDIAQALAVIDRFRPRVDAALVQVSPPWTRLLAGDDPATLVAANELGLSDYYRGKGLTHVVVSVDPTNGLDRSADAPELVSAGRSLTEPAVQDLFRRYVVAMAAQLQPEWLGIASETNLVRAAAPPALYQALVDAANGAAADVAAQRPGQRLFVTVQVETAWGRPGTTFVGIDRDRSDFPFSAALGLSSYPYLAGFQDPAQLPDDYFARLVAGAPLPLLAIEGGWPSVSVAGAVSDPDLQARYIARQADLLDVAGAIAWFQITFTDLDLSAWPPGVEPFAYNGLVTTTLADKPALATWDAVFARPLQ